MRASFLPLLFFDPLTPSTRRYVLLKEILGLQPNFVLPEAFAQVWTRTVRDIGGAIGWEEMEKACRDADPAKGEESEGALPFPLRSP